MFWLRPSENVCDRREYLNPGSTSHSSGVKTPLKEPPTPINIALLRSEKTNHDERYYLCPTQQHAI